MSLWSLAALLLYLPVPESPKYLVSQERFHEARDILTHIYVRNTGQPANTFPFKDIWKDRSTQVQEEVPAQRKSTLSQQLMVGLHNLKPLFHKPQVLHLGLFCTIILLLMWLFNVLRLWYPQLSTIVEHYRRPPHAGDLCRMLDAYTADLRWLHADNRTLPDCVTKKSGIETYVNTIGIGCLGVLTFLLNGVLVNRVGKKYLMFAAAVICTAATLSLRWAASSLSIFLLFATILCAARIVLCLVQATAVQHFPTTTRAMSISLIMLCGRVATLAGNVTFPALLQLGCVVPFSVFTAMIASITLLILLVPNNKKT